MKDSALGWWLPLGFFLGVVFWGAVAFEGAHLIIGWSDGLAWDLSPSVWVWSKSPDWWDFRADTTPRRHLLIASGAAITC